MKDVGLVFYCIIEWAKMKTFLKTQFSFYKLFLDFISWLTRFMQILCDVCFWCLGVNVCGHYVGYVELEDLHPHSSLLRIETIFRMN